MQGNRARGVCLLGLLIGCAADPAAPPPEKVWVAVAEEDLGIFAEVAGVLVSPDVIHDGQRVGLAEVPETLLGVLASAFHEQRHRCGGFVTFVDKEQADRRMDLLAVNEEVIIDYALDDASLAVLMRDAIDKARILDTIKGLTTFPSRYYSKTSGKQAAEWLRDRWQTYIGQRTDAKVELWPHSWLQPSVILTIDGSTFPDEVVVVGGHLDSIAGFFGTSNAPGADDDASGVATLSEVARVMLEKGVKPARTVKFMAYAAEEVGLRGSADIAESFAEQGITVVGVLQLDMVAYKGSMLDVQINQSHSNPAQNAFLANLLKTYLPELKVGNFSCGYACSDHASWTAHGFAASNPFEADMNTMNKKIHTTGDTMTVFGNNADHAVKFGRLTATYVAELASGAVVIAAP